MIESLEDVLADERETANRLRITGHADEARNADRMLDRIARAAEDFTTWLVEPDACLRSGEKPSWFRRRFPEWARMGHARKVGRVYQYRRFVVPVKLDLHAVREAARRGERMSA